MRLSPNDGSSSSSEEQKQSNPRRYRLSGRMLLALVLTAAFAGGVLALSDLPGYLKANFGLARHPEGTAALLAKDDLAVIRLEMKFKHFQKIEQKRREALQNTHGRVHGGPIRRLLASDEDFVPAIISVNDKNVDCKVRLKGDLEDHWSGRKWSLRVQVNKDGSVLGMSRFSLQDPATRHHTNEWLFLENLRMEDLFATRYRFVNLVLNGKPLGTYVMEEHFSKELIEGNRRREGIVINFDDHQFWNLHWNVSWQTIYRTAAINVRNSGRVAQSELLQQQKTAAVNLLRGLQERRLSGDDVFDPERLGKFLAITHLWNAEHALAYDDINFYFDPITGNLEPVGMEGNPRATLELPHCYFSSGEMEDTWLNHALRSPSIAREYIKHLDLFTQPKYLAKVKTALEAKEKHLRHLLIKDLYMEDKHTIWHASTTLLEHDPWGLLEKRAQEIRFGLVNKHIALVYARTAETVSGVDCEVIIRNALSQPIEIIGFELGERSWPAKETLSIPLKERAIISPIEGNVVIPLRKFSYDHPSGDHVFLLEGAMNKEETPNQENKTQSSLMAVVRILGLEESLVRLPVSMDSAQFEGSLLPFHSPKEEAKEIHTFLRKKGTRYTIPSGDHNVTKDLIIPSGNELFIDPGTTLRFATDATLISEGSIQASGTPDAPITLTALGNSWGGVLVKNAPERSEWHHVKVNKVAGIGIDGHAKGIDRAGWTLTGGVTFYHSPLTLVNCSFEKSSTEDALNVISSDCRILGCSFSELYSDAFDGDFITGFIRNSVFTDIKGDAIDLSGSNVTIENVVARKVGDKAISVGENTWAKLKNGLFEDIGIGVASKDLSETLVYDLKINRAKVAALTAYQKKETYGPARISVMNLQVTETEKIHLVQEGSTLSIDGRSLPAIPLDIDELYAEEPATP